MGIKKSLYQYPGIRHSDDITQLVKEYFNDMDLSYFGHVIVWPEGKYSIICIKHDWPIEIVTSDLPPATFTRYDQVTNKIVFPNMDQDDILGYPDGILEIAKEKFNILNPMMITRKYDDHIEAFGFDLHNEKPYETYLHNLDVFENFIHYYKDRASKIIHAANQRCILINPKYHKQKMNTKGVPLTNKNLRKVPNLKRYYIQYKNADVVLSEKEFHCLSLLAHGKKGKTIAAEMNISLRTVETYIERIKVKFHLSQREDLIAIYWQSRLLSV
ncbi:MAG: helix-turn-helix transcriptional regulator [Gammaproteobacteria bacterium]|nr:helix-turn-helix transcriptional regulator [Gammaproteobacteria bacterium]